MRAFLFELRITHTISLLKISQGIIKYIKKAKAIKIFI